MPRFVPRVRKHKVLARQQTLAESTSTDTNTDVLLPLTRSEKDVRRQQLRTELQAQQPGAVSSKKQKRLDKYIEKKLRKDETQDLLHKLEQQKLEQDKKAELRISKTDEGEPTLVDRSPKRKWSDYVQGQRYDSSDTGSSSGSDEDEVDDFRNVSAVIGPNNIETSGAKASSILGSGSGLAQPLLLGEDGLPVVRTRPGKHSVKISLAEGMLADDEAEEIPWEGFEDEDSFGNDDAQADDSAQDSSDSSAEDYDSEEDMSHSSRMSDSDDVVDQRRPRPRASAFKAWATQQLNKSIGHVPSYEIEQSTPPVPGEPDNLPGTIRRPGEQNGVETTNVEGAILPDTSPPVTRNPAGAISAENVRKVYAVLVNRSPKIRTSREQLPVVQREQEIMEAIHSHAVVIIKGETGSGKTTQVPQFLYEAGYGSPHTTTSGMIGITQPRRVAAISMADRVRKELGDHGEKVAHQVRFDSNVSSSTAIKFMTDGILMRELSQDLLLRKYSAIVVDEAHERSINTDILIGMLSKIVVARTRKQQGYEDPKPLKLVIMSATLGVEDFVSGRLFPQGSKPPIVESEGRQHRVTTHFALRSRAGYVEEVIEKVQRAHHKLPKGGILVFLTGQDEIRTVLTRLKQALPNTGPSAASGPRIHIAAKDAPLEAEDFDFGTKMDTSRMPTTDDDYEIDIIVNSDEEDDNEFNVSDGDDNEEDGTDLVAMGQPPASGLGRTPVASKTPYSSVHVLPLYSQLPTKDQLKVFEPPPPGSRLIILATNIAETSLTIPGIRYVFDSGRSKERKYNLDTGVQSFEIDYISKASAQQRAGRAGRTGPGHCWRLYSSAVYEQFFPEHGQPEILRAPAENVVLQLKSLSYPLPVSKFPFPTQPSIQSLDKAERLLQHLGALTSDGTVTELGRELSIFPLSPRLGKILATAVREPIMISHLIAVVAGLAVSDIYVQETQVFPNPVEKQDGEVYSREARMQDEEREQHKQSFGRARAKLSRLDKSSDAAKLLAAIEMYTGAENTDLYCKEYFLKQKPLFEVNQLLQQLRQIVQANYVELLDKRSASYTKLSSKQIQHINSVVAAGYIDQVAIRADLAPNPPEIAVKPKRAIDVPYLPLIPLTARSSAQLLERVVFIHPSSVLARFSAKELPQYIVYSHLQQSQPSAVGSDQLSKTRMFPLTPITGPTLVALAKDTSLIHFGKPVANTKIEDVAGFPKRRECWLSVELRGSSVGFGWPMPPLKVRQVLDKKDPSGWRIEQILG